MKALAKKRKIRLGIDARILSQTMNGVARCTIAILEGLKGSEQFEVCLFSDTPIRDEYRHYLSGYKLIVLKNRRLKGLWKNWILPFHLFKEGIDLYHATWDKGVPILSPCARVMTIYDLYSISEHNKRIGAEKKLSRFLILRLETFLCRKIFTISENTKNEITAKLGVSPSKITVIYPDCDRRRIKESVASGPGADFPYKELDGSEYFISIVGRFEDVRKNVPLLVKAFCRFVDKDRPRNSRYKLALVGDCDRNSESYRKVMDIIDSFRLRDNIVITGYVEDNILYRLLQSSKIMIFPSLFEGFGIPLLEAFLLGVPVIAGDSSAIPEIAGLDGALLIDPASEEKLADAISSMCGDGHLRERFIKNGFKRLNDFSWEQTMDRILTTYANLCARQKAQRGA